MGSYKWLNLLIVVLIQIKRIQRLSLGGPDTQIDTVQDLQPSVEMCTQMIQLKNVCI